MDNINLKIDQIFENNKLNDLQSFLSKRKCLNTCNITLLYLFHIIQSIGILTSTIGTGYDIKYLIWTGISLNILASLLNIFEKNNNSISLRLLEDIKNIKSNNYIDEAIIINDDLDMKLKPSDKQSYNSIS